MSTQSRITWLLCMLLSICTLAAKQHPAEGEIVPDFTLLNQYGEPVQLYALLEQSPVILIFYPHDESTVCTKQWCTLRDLEPAIRAKGITIVGINTETPQVHASFAAHHTLPFQMLSDPDGTVAHHFGATYLWGKLPRRSTILINQQKMVVARYDKLKGLFDIEKHIDIIRKALAESL